MLDKLLVGSLAFGAGALFMHLMYNVKIKKKEKSEFVRTDVSMKVMDIDGDILTLVGAAGRLIIKNKMLARYSEISEFVLIRAYKDEVTGEYHFDEFYNVIDYKEEIDNETDNKNCCCDADSCTECTCCNDSNSFRNNGICD